MRKIPTLFLRDPENMARVTTEVHPDCQWVMDGEGVPTRKYDGTCVMLDAEGRWWGRREVKCGKPAPRGFVEVDHDDATGKSVGWEPIEQTPFYKAFQSVDRDDVFGLKPHSYVPGTYELCGPKINGNPEGYDHHVLIRHADAETTVIGVLNPVTVRNAVLILAELGWEGIVWHHPDGRAAKLKARDYPGGSR